VKMKKHVTSGQIAKSLGTLTQDLFTRVRKDIKSVVHKQLRSDGLAHCMNCVKILEERHSLKKEVYCIPLVYGLETNATVAEAYPESGTYKIYKAAEPNLAESLKTAFKQLGYKTA